MSEAVSADVADQSCPDPSPPSQYAPDRSCLAALVLAGGQSRRMGQDKALLQLQGEALLTRTCRTALTVSQRTVVITTRPEYQSLLPQGCELLLEANPQGPLTAFAQGLDQIKLEQIKGNERSWVLLLACDLPLLTAEDLAGAIARLSALPADVDAYLPAARPSDFSKRIDWEPLCGFYRLHCLVALKAAIAQGTRSFQHWLRGLKVAPLSQWSPEHLLNCNRPEDWARVLKIVGESG